MLSPKYGYYIDKETFTGIEMKIRRKWATREVLPPNTPAALATQPKVLNHYRSVSRSNYGLARGLIPYIEKHILKVPTEYRWSDDEANSKFDKTPVTELAAHQKIALNHIIKSYNASKPIGDCLLQMETGLGKTRVGISLIGKLGRRTLIIVPTKHIAEQWKDEIEYLMPNIKVSMYTNKTNQLTNVNICVINTARKKPTDFYAQFGLVIFDEVHEYVSTQSKHVLWNSSSARYRLGLTATPEYAGNGLLPFIEAHLGKANYANMLEGFSVVAKYFNVSVDVYRYVGGSDYLTPVLNKANMVSTTDTISNMISDPDRIDLLLSIIRSLYVSGKNILVFAEHRRFLDDLALKLCSNGNNGNNSNDDESSNNIINKDDLVLETDASVLKGGVTKDEINAAKTKRIIFTTYCYSRRGVSYDHLDTLILASPRRSGSKQIIGRILRYSSDVKIPRLIVDIWDVCSVVKSQFYDRKKIYNDRKYKTTYHLTST